MFDAAVIRAASKDEIENEAVVQSGNLYLLASRRRFGHERILLRTHSEHAVCVRRLAVRRVTAVTRPPRSGGLC